MSTVTARVSEVGLSAGATKTLIQIVAATNSPMRLTELTCSFDGVDGTKEPIVVELLRQSTAGTSSSLTMVKDDELGPAIKATALQTFTAEPTAGDVLRSWEVTPAGGMIPWQWPLGNEIVATTRLALRVTTAAGVTCNASASLTFME